MMRLLAFVLPLLLCCNGEVVQIISRNNTAPHLTTKSIPPMKFGGCTYDTVKINPNGYFTLGPDVRMHHTIPYLDDFPMPVISPRGAADKLRLYYMSLKELVLFNMITLDASALNASTDSNLPPPCVDTSSMPLKGNVTIWQVSYQTFTDVKSKDFESDSRAYLIYDANTTFLLFYHVVHAITDIYKRSFVYGFSYGYRDSSLPPTYLAVKNVSDQSDLTATFEQVAQGTNIADENGAPGCYLYQIMTAGTCKPRRNEPFSRHQMSVVRSRVVNYNRQLVSPTMSPFSQCRVDSTGRRTICSCRKGYVGNGYTCTRDDLWIPVNETASQLQVSSGCLQLGEEYSEPVPLNHPVQYGADKYEYFRYYEDGIVEFVTTDKDDSILDQFSYQLYPAIAVYAADVNATNAKICHLVAPGPLSGVASWNKVEEVIASMRKEAPFKPTLSMLVSYEDIAPMKLNPDDFQVFRNPYRSGFESTSAQVLLVADKDDTYMFLIYRFNNYSYALPWNESNAYDVKVGFSALQEGDAISVVDIVSLPQNITDVKLSQTSVINAYALDQYVGNYPDEWALTGWAYKVSNTFSEPRKNSKCSSDFRLHGRMLAAKLQNSSTFDCVSREIGEQCRNTGIYDVTMACSKMTLISRASIPSFGANVFWSTLDDHGANSTIPLIRYSFSLDLQLSVPCSSPSKQYMEMDSHVATLARRAISSALLRCGSIAEQRSTQIDRCFPPINPRFEVTGPANLSLPVTLNKTYVSDIIRHIRLAYEEKHNVSHLLINSPVVVEGKGDRYNMTVLIQGLTCEDEPADFVVPKIDIPDLQPVLLAIESTTPALTTDSSTVVESSTTQQVAAVQQNGSRKVRALLTGLCIVFALLACVLTFFVVKFYRQIKMSARRKAQYDRVEFFKSTTSIVRATEDDENNIIDRPAGMRDEAIFRIDS